MIDTSKWKEFRVGDLFDISSTKTTPLETLENEIGYGDYPYVTTQATENGVAGFYKVSTERGGVLTVDSAVLGQCFYQKNDFSASDHVEKLIPKFHMTDSIALFMVTIMNQEQYKYSYGRKRSQKVLRNECISLPATPSGEPDWKYMEDFMGGLYSEPLKTSVKSSHIPLETEKWGEFRVGDLFECINGSMHSVDDELTEKSVDYYTTAEINNGYGGTVSDYKASDVIMVPSLTVGSRGNDSITYFHNPPYIANQNLTVCIPRNPIPTFAMQFVATIIRQEKYRFSYGRIMSKEAVRNTVIRLPQTPDGEPDWKWMEDYMRSLPYSDLIAA